jgi:fucose 4-O-acetylase-like acetyltransferase
VVEYKSESRLPTSGATRLAWLDYAKGVGILLVVAGHANQSIHRTPGLVWSDGFKLFDTLIYSFHMPLFFVLAGYAANLGQRKSTKDFAWGLFWAMAVPYFVWSVIWIAMKASLPDYANVPVTWQTLGVILWDPVEHMWFLYHLIVIAVAWFGLRQLNQPWVTGVVVFTVVIASVALRADGGEWSWLAFGLENFVMFAFGAVALGTILEWCERSVAPAAVYALCAVAWASIAHLMAGENVAHVSLAAAILGSVAAIGLARLLPGPQSSLLKGLATLGQASLVIYLTHLIFLAAARVALSHSGYLTEWSLLAVGTLASIVLALALYNLVQAIGRATGLRISEWIGFGPMRVARYETPSKFPLRAEPQHTA